MACLLASFCCAIGSWAIHARKNWEKTDCAVYNHNGHTFAKPVHETVYQDMGKTTVVFNTSTITCWVKGGKDQTTISLTEQTNPPSQSKEMGYYSLWFLLGAVFLGTLDACEKKKICCWSPNTNKPKTNDGMVEMEEEISI